MAKIRVKHPWFLLELVGREALPWTIWWSRSKRWPPRWTFFLTQNTIWSKIKSTINQQFSCETNMLCCLDLCFLYINSFCISCTGILLLTDLIFLHDLMLGKGVLHSFSLFILTSTSCVFFQKKSQVHNCSRVFHVFFLLLGPTSSDLLQQLPGHPLRHLLPHRAHRRHGHLHHAAGDPHRRGGFGAQCAAAHRFDFLSSLFFYIIIYIDLHSWFCFINRYSWFWSSKIWMLLLLLLADVWTGVG